ncbi:MAG: hypothetical protein OYH77_01290 [Pseudomonadota bacterium]|nr:hypothetical protein [Pseudomonadota bacterium]
MLTTSQHKIFHLALVLLLVACGTAPDADLKAVTDKTLALGIVRTDDTGKEFNLMLCRWQKAYSREDIAANCMPALIDADGKAAVIPYDFPVKRTQIMVAGAAKWAVSVALLAAASYFIGKKLLKVIARTRHKNIDMNSITSLEKLKLEADENLSHAKKHLASVEERLMEAKKVRLENYHDNGIPPNNRRFVPLLRTTDFKAIDSLETAKKRAKKTLTVAEKQASETKTMYHNAKALYQWNVNQSKDIPALKERLLKDLENIKVNAVIIKDGKSYTSMPIAKLRELIAHYGDKVMALRQELNTLKTATSKRAQRRKAKLLARIEAYEEMIASNKMSIVNLEDAIKAIKASDTTISAEQYQQIYRTMVDTTTALKGNNIFQVMTATASAVLVSRIISPLTAWGRDERMLAKYWHALFYQYSDMDFATPIDIDVRANLKVLAKKVFPQFKINPAIETFVAGE